MPIELDYDVENYKARPPTNYFVHHQQEVTDDVLFGVFLQEAWSVDRQLLLADIVERAELHQELVDSWRRSGQDDVRYYSLPVSTAFRSALGQCPLVSADARVMGGAPCIRDTRIPVYMVLDAIEHHGSLEGALESYPQLTMTQVKEALGFAKLVVECPLGDDEA